MSSQEEEARESETQQQQQQQQQQQRSLSNPDDKESSPKRSRRDGKPATERNSSSNRSLDIVERTDEDQKHRRRLQDALPLEAPLDEPESKVGPDAANRELNKKTDGPLDGSKHSSHPVEVSRSRSFFQHDERGSAEQSGRSVGRRTATDHRLGSSSKDRPIDRVGDRMNVQKLQQRDDRSQAREDDKVWRHDGFFELEADAPNPARKRAFREKKLEFESANAAGGTSTEPDRASRLDRSFSGNARREERGDRPRELDRYGRSFAGDRVPPHRGETHRPSFSSRERFNGSNSFRGRDRISGRPGERNEYRPNSFRAEKWKHDLYDEANRSPTPKNEEDQIAKIEALLAL